MKTPSNAVEAIGNPIHQVFRESGITAEYLVKKLKKELNAERTVLQKVKGLAEVPLTPTGKPKKGLKIVTTTGFIEKRFVDGDIEKEFTDGETVIAINMTDWTTLQGNSSLALLIIPSSILISFNSESATNISCELSFNPKLLLTIIGITILPRLSIVKILTSFIIFHFK